MPSIAFTDYLGNPLEAGSQASVFTVATNSFAASGYLASDVNLIQQANLPSQNNWTLANGMTYSPVAGPNASPAFVYYGTGSASGSATAASNQFNVQPGGSYNFSGYVNSSNVLSGTPQLLIMDTTLSIVYGSYNITTTAASAYSSTFIVPNSVSYVRFVFSTNNSVVQNTYPLVFTQPTVSANLGSLAITSTALVSSTLYYAKFMGGNAPQIATNPFSGNLTTAMVTGYVSPTSAVATYVSALIGLQPTGWYSDAAKTTGGTLFALMSGLGSLLETLDNENQQNQALMRLQSCVDVQVDSWVADYFGTSLPRFPGETDGQYIARAIVNLRSDKSTLSGLYNILNYFGSNIYISEPWSAVESQGCDGFLTCDSAGSEVGQQTSFIRIFLTSNNQISNAQLKSTIIGIRPAGIPLELVNIISGQGTVL